MFVRSLKRIVRQMWTILTGRFNHRTAQRYEIISAHGNMRRTFPKVFAAWEQDRAQGGLWQSGQDQWFQGNNDLWATFVAHVRDRTNLEVGSGAFGYLAPCYWMKRRIVIDPLIDKHRVYQIKRFGKTFWTDDIETHAIAVEMPVKELRGAVDGCIVSRNALDHMEDPLAALEMIAEYAASGCYLLLWTDIWHMDGGDVGHRNITRSQTVMERLLDGLGFSILQNSAQVRNSAECIEYGCLARKR